MISLGDFPGMLFLYSILQCVLRETHACGHNCSTCYVHCVGMHAQFKDGVSLAKVER